MFLIASGAYINQEMRSEFGAIPPVFLPLGNKKLLEFQINLITSTFPNEDIYLSLPEGFNFQGKIQEKINIVESPVDLSFPEAILYVMNITKNNDNHIRILNGDTLFSSLPKELDVVTVETKFNKYDWDFIDASNKRVLTGFFAFKDKKDLIKCLTLSRGNLRQSISLYQSQHSLSVRSPTKWFDLGHLNSYFESRSEITTERAFNAIKVINGVLWKTGKPTAKIKAEALWYEAMPASFRVNLPQYLGTKNENGKFWYGIEYLPFLPLNELYVHGKQSKEFWLETAKKLIEILNSFALTKHNNNSTAECIKFSQSMYVEKTIKRIQEINNDKILKNHFTRLNLDKVADICVQKTLDLPEIPSFLHGDFCFSNILFSARGKSIKLIDPRGLDGYGNPSIYGDQKYDIAKLTHSIIGLYDYIISGEYKIDAKEQISFFIDNDIKDFQNEFLNLSIGGLTIKDCIPLVVLLFITMVPLHNDRPDRQQAFLINAKQIFNKYV